MNNAATANGQHTDQRTLAAYNQKAVDFASDWRTQPPPEELYALLRRFFHAGGRTADIGCGCGRDTDWLRKNGFAAAGYEPSSGLLAEARRIYPEVCFYQTALPELDGIARGSFANVLCETVLMHLPSAVIPSSVRSLMDLLEYGGILYLSWRVTRENDERDAKGRLYSSFDASFVLQQLDSESILLDEEVVSVSSGKCIHRIIARKETR